MALLPTSFTRTDRAPLVAEPAVVVAGALPADLAGSYFLVGPAGSAASGGLPYPAGGETTVLCGDGRLLRLDIAAGSASVTTRIVATPDQNVDAASLTVPGGDRFGFSDRGITRVGVLGVRNTLNTALLVIPPGPAWTNPRLILTSDAGVPWEIDPTSLELVTPIGERLEWRASGNEWLPFRAIFGTAHPVWDAHNHQAFFINYGKGVDDFLRTIPMFDVAEELQQSTRRRRAKLLGALGWDELSASLDGAYVELRRLRFAVQRALPAPLRTRLPARFTVLCRWDGVGDLERWDVLDPDGVPVVLQESCHQIAVTDQWVLILDTAARVGARSLMDQPFPGTSIPNRLLRDAASRRVGDRGRLWLVRRADLLSGPGPVQARAIDLPLGACHFLADADDSAGTIRLYVSHNCATDVFQWVTPYDQRLDNGGRVPRRAVGLPPAPVDVSRYGVYDIDPEAVSIRRSAITASEEHFWEMALVAGPGIGLPTPPPTRHGDLFWTSFGLTPEVATRAQFTLYRDYPGRLIPAERVQAMMTTGGMPSSLYRLGLDPGDDPPAASVRDAYVAPAGVLLGSPQFVPKPVPTPPTPEAQDGWIIAMAWLPDVAGAATPPEFWIWDAAALAAGPICQLRCDALQQGFAAHTAWLPKLLPRDAIYTRPWKPELLAIAARLGARARAFIDLYA